MVFLTLTICAKAPSVMCNWLLNKPLFVEVLNVLQKTFQGTTCLFVCLNVLFGFVKFYEKSFWYYNISWFCSFLQRKRTYFIYIQVVGRKCLKSFYFCFRILESINPFHATCLFLCPPENRKLKVFWCFQGAKKETSDMKWVKVSWNIGMEWGRYCRQISLLIFSKFWSELINF